MRRLLIISLISLAGFQMASAQKPIDRSIVLYNSIPAETKLQLYNALDTLLLHINSDKISSAEINSAGAALSRSVFGDLKGMEANGKALQYYQPKVINLYPVTGNRYMISIAYQSNSAIENRLKAIIDLTAVMDSGKVAFSIPLYYLTRNWKTTQVGNVTYHYADEINIPRAKLFDKKNTRIAQKLGLRPEHLDFYLCDNHQEIFKLLGYEYNSAYAGTVADGYGIDAGVIFSVMHNEDFSHDAFHYYAGKIRKNARNSIAEEGLAYSWGNAYYTDDNGAVITAAELVPVLKQYLKEHPQVSLLDLFTKNPMIFPHQTKVRSLISSVICDEVELRGGITAIKELIDCGKGDDSYFKVVTKFTGINIANFDEKVMQLINNYK